MKQVTLGELVKYVLDNRKGAAFKDYSEELIAIGIKRASDEDRMIYACRPDNSVCGIVVAHSDDELKIMFIEDILTSERWVLPKFVSIFRQRFPDYQLKAQRKGHIMTYNTSNFVNKVLAKEAK